MTYKDLINGFERRYTAKTFGKSAVQQFRNKEILGFAGEVQAELANKYRLINNIFTINLQSGVSVYALSGLNNVAIAIQEQDVLDVWEVKLNDPQMTRLNKVGIQNIPSPTTPYVVPFYNGYNFFGNARMSGLPTQYTFYGTNNSKSIEVDTIPNMTYDTNSASAYRLNIHYFQRADYFDSSAGTINNTVWSDYDETNNKDFGGSFKLPWEWHSIILDGVMGMLFPEEKVIFMNNVKDMLDNKPIAMTTTIPAFLGVSNNGSEVVNNQPTNIRGC